MSSPLNSSPCSHCTPVCAFSLSLVGRSSSCWGWSKVLVLVPADQACSFDVELNALGEIWFSGDVYWDCVVSYVARAGGKFGVFPLPEPEAETDMSWLARCVSFDLDELELSFTKTGLASSIPTVNFMNSAAFEETRSVQRYSASFSL